MFRSVLASLSLAAGLVLSSGAASAAYISTVDLNTTNNVTLVTNMVGGLNSQGVDLPGAYQQSYDYQIIGSGADTTFSLVQTEPDRTQVRYFLYEDTGTALTLLYETNPVLRDIANTSTASFPFFSWFLAAGSEYVLRINKTQQGWDSISTQISAVPLPGAALLFGTALAGFFGFSNRRKV